MRIKVNYVENREVIRFEKFDNLFLSEGALEKIRSS